MMLLLLVLHVVLINKFYKASLDISRPLEKEEKENP